MKWKVFIKEELIIKDLEVFINNYILESKL